MHKTKYIYSIIWSVGDFKIQIDNEGTTHRNAENSKQRNDEILSNSNEEPRKSNASTIKIGESSKSAIRDNIDSKIMGARSKVIAKNDAGDDSVIDDESEATVEGEESDTDPEAEDNESDNNYDSGEKSDENSKSDSEDNEPVKVESENSDEEDKSDQNNKANEKNESKFEIKLY